MPPVLRVLLAVDHPRNAPSVERELGRSFDPVQITSVDRDEALRQALERNQFDVALVDHPLAWTDGKAVLRALRAHHPDRAIVLLATADHETDALRALDLGDVDGYAVRNASGFDRLTASVRAALALARRRQALGELEAHIRGLFDTAPVGLYRVTLDGTLLEVNDALVQMMGHPDRRSAMAVRTPDLYFDKADRERWLETVKRDGSARGVDLRLRRFDGSPIWVSVNIQATRDANGRILHLEGSVTDITARRRAEDALRQSQAFLDGVMNSVPDVILTVRLPERVVEYANQAVAETFGYAPEELAGRDTRVLYPDESTFLAFGEKVRQLLASDRTRLRTEQTFRRKSGRDFPAELHGTIVRVGGQPDRLISVIRDATERKALEEQVRESHKAEAIGRLAGGVAHDFNNVLTAILGYAALLSEELKQDPRLRADVEEIRRAGERAAALTQQLLAFGRRQVVQPAVLDINTTIQDIEDTLGRLLGEDIELRLRLAPDLLPIRIDPRQLHQLLLSLTTNAHDAMPAGGRCTIETAGAHLDAQAVRDRPGLAPGRYVSLAVTDTGPGMDAETVKHAFEPFFTTPNRSKGTGLNLATVYAIVKQAGGDVDVRSAPDRGTTFTVYLPCVTQAVEVEPAAAVAPPDAHVKRTVLLAEDEDTVRALARQALVRQGYNVLAAGDGEQALRAAEHHDGPIDLLLTDVIMPGMNGPELAEKLAAERPETRVLFMSGHAGDALDRFGLRREKVAFLPKPFTPEILVRRVRDAIG